MEVAHLVLTALCGSRIVERSPPGTICGVKNVEESSRWLPCLCREGKENVGGVDIDVVLTGMIQQLSEYANCGGWVYIDKEVK